MLSSDKKTIKLFKFYIKGIDTPMIIQAEDRDQALGYFATELKKRPNIQNVVLEDIKFITPVFGVTKTEEDGIDLIWAGLEYSTTGWLTTSDFKKINVKI